MEDHFIAVRRIITYCNYEEKGGSGIQCGIFGMVPSVELESQVGCLGGLDNDANNIQ